MCVIPRSRVLLCFRPHQRYRSANLPLEQQCGLYQGDMYRVRFQGAGSPGRFPGINNGSNAAPAQPLNQQVQSTKVDRKPSEKVFYGESSEVLRNTGKRYCCTNDIGDCPTGIGETVNEW